MGQIWHTFSAGRPLCSQWPYHYSTDRITKPIAYFTVSNSGLEKQTRADTRTHTQHLWALWEMHLKEGKNRERQGEAINLEEKCRANTVTKKNKDLLEEFIGWGLALTKKWQTILQIIFHYSIFYHIYTFVPDASSLLWLVLCDMLNIF